jgi:hypothetical protein
LKQSIVTKEVSGIASAIYDMRKPMESKNDSILVFENDRIALIDNIEEKDEVLLRKLARAKSGSGHDNVLKSITVHMDITATHDFILQYYRYSFRDTTSSTSKMHCIHKGSIEEKCSDNVSIHTIHLVDSMIDLYNTAQNDKDIQECFNNGSAYYWGIHVPPITKKELFECIIHNTPLGYMLTFGEVTNYLQLKTMWNQRKNHKMSMWNTTFVEWVKSLPYSLLITGEE